MSFSFGFAPVENENVSSSYDLEEVPEVVEDEALKKVKPRPIPEKHHNYITLNVNSNNGNETKPDESKVSGQVKEITVRSSVEKPLEQEDYNLIQEMQEVDE